MTESWSQHRHEEKNYCLMGCDMGYSYKNLPAFQKNMLPSIFHQNVSEFLLNYVASYTRRQYSSRFN
jgi:hypothetical protein